MSEIRAMKIRRTAAGNDPNDNRSDPAYLKENAALEAVPKHPKPNGKASPRIHRMDEFLAYLPEHKYIYRPTGDLWLSPGINSTLPKVGKLSASAHLDLTAPVQQMTWIPGEPEIVEDRLVVDGGWKDHPGARIYNLYRPAIRKPGNPHKAGLWESHVRRLYGQDADHIIKWLAQRVQAPAEKVNHAIVLGGGQGIGKDSILEPVKAGVGPWNWSEISPSQMLGRFNGWVKSIVLRVSEARDLGEINRFAFYDHSKTYIAAPPDVLRVDEKNRQEYPVFNRCGVILTTNHKLDGIYLPPDDRRHFVAWSEATKEDFGAKYWADLWQWYESGGTWDVVAYLATLDLDGFNPKAPPPRTAAFDAIVHSGHSPEELELQDLLARLNQPKVTTVADLADAANQYGFYDLAHTLKAPSHARKIPHKLERAEYEVAVNPGRKDGRWRLGSGLATFYARKGLSRREILEAIGQRGVNV